ncbi:unnamed protein product [Blepharisma stoltei]|uniref:Transmembrane protein 135 N-terminal domain-containing protein n=1 Tax=Blepharisma stoltei TaxID=1481888 RepID=A0AAU9IP59_9CILI|nr:unnamed protein product [Blepharisma stoltei]
MDPVKKYTPELIEKFRAGEYVPCSIAFDNSCEYDFIKRVLIMYKLTFIFYAPAHILPVLIFKLRQLKRDPIPMLKHLAINILKSTTFGALIGGLTVYLRCLTNRLFKGTTRLNWLLITPLASLSILIENPGRKTELTLYLLPRAIETIWNMLRSRKWVFRIPYFEVFLMGLAMGTLTYFLNNEPEYIKPTYRSTLTHLFGKS